MFCILQCVSLWPQGSKLYNSSIDPAEALVPNILNNKHIKLAGDIAAGAAIRVNSTFVLLDSQLLGNTAEGAGGGVFATSPYGVVLQCSDDDASAGRAVCMPCGIILPNAHAT